MVLVLNSITAADIEQTFPPADINPNLAGNSFDSCLLPLPQTLTNTL